MSEHVKESNETIHELIGTRLQKPNEQIALFIMQDIKFWFGTENIDIAFAECGKGILELFGN